MRAVMTLVFLAALAAAFTSLAECDSTEQDGMSFAWPHRCAIDGREGLCLRELLPSGLTVALVRETGICYAKTDTAFSDEHRTPEDPSVGTVLARSENCWSAVDRSLYGGFVLAVIGVDHVVVRLVPLSNDELPVPKRVELKARVIEPAIYNPCMTDRMLGYKWIWDVELHKVLRVGDSLFRIFDKGGGPIILFRNNDVFRLRGNHAFGAHVFFSVNEKLYLTYEGYDCLGCSKTYKTRYVYDLSGGTPKLVYDDRFQR